MKALVALLAIGVPVMAAPETLLYAIPASALSEALLLFEKQSHRQVLFDVQALHGLKSPGLKGAYSPEQALRRLLEGTGWAFSLQGRAFRLHTSEITLPVVRVKAKAERTSGQTELDAKAIGERSMANRGLADLLATRPGVRLDNAANSSLNRGSLDQPEISFHGASPTQNLFLIDGADATSRFDPASKNGNIQIGNVPSNSQAYFIDPVLLGSVSIHDHDIPVEYGRFQGGVVDARLGRATGKNVNTFGYEHSRSNWEKTQVSSLDSKFFEAGRPGYTPEWRKHALGLTVDQMLGDHWGVIGGLSRRMSSIRRTGTNGPVFTRDQVDNLLAKVSRWASDRTTHDFTVKASRRDDNYISDFFVDSRWNNQHDAMGFTYDLEHQAAIGKLEVKLGMDFFSDHRWSSKREFVVHVIGKTQWSEVGFGTEETQEDAAMAKAIFRFNERQAGGFSHQMMVGLDARHIQTGFHRHHETASYNEYRPTPEAPPIQRNLTTYSPGKVDVAFGEQALFFSDRLSRGDFSFTPGLRLDHDSFLGRHNLAPRAVLEWRFGGNAQRVFSAGQARYFGTGQHAMAISEAKSRMVTRLTDSTGKPILSTTLPAPSLYEGLRTPYTDEITLGYRHTTPTLQWAFTALRRDGKDQIHQESVKATATTAAGQRYLNGGRSRTDSLLAEWESKKAWHLLGAAWGTKGAVSWQHAQRNHELLTSYKADILREKVYYNGKLIDANALPPADYNQNLKANALLVGQWKGAGLSLLNELKWSGRYPKPFYRGLNKQDGYEIYEDVTVGGHMFWDASLGWVPTFAQRLDLRLIVKNVLNRIPALEISDPTLSYNRDTFATGRSFEVQIKVAF